MEAPRIVVRFAQPGDLDFLRPKYVTDAITLRKIEWQEIAVAERDNTLVGHIWLEYLWSVVPYVALIWVLPEYRREGVGKALLSFTESFLRSKEHDTLYSSSQANEPEPQAWHRHMGFEECGIIAGINEGGIGEIFFRKNLR